MLWLPSVIVFAFGRIVGSVLNVVIYRYQTGRTVLGRSGCLRCGHQLAWYELVPVLSFLAQRGRCRACGAKISWQYPLVELLTAYLFCASFNLWGGLLIWPVFLDWLLLSLLIVITVYDFRHQIIPDHFVYAFGALALLRAVWLGAPGAPVIVGLSLFAFFAFLWLVSSGRWIGFGDAKLVIGLGLFLGWPDALSATVLAFWIGAAVGLALIAFQRYNVKSEVPFAPFLVLGTLLVYLYQLDIFSLFLIS